MDKYLYREFESYFPHLANDVVECFDGMPFELIAQLKDGQVFSYYGLEHSILSLPSDAYSLTEEECKKEFGIRLNRLMFVKNITQKMLSEKTGIAQGNISNYITGRTSPSFYVVDRIAKALDCSIEEFRCIY